MATMGKYCKAYQVKQLREFSQWQESVENTRLEPQEIDGKATKIRRSLTEDDFLYLQENYVVTDGIFKDENVIFDCVTPDWETFCQKALGFDIPTYEAPTYEAVSPNI